LGRERRSGTSVQPPRADAARQPAAGPCDAAKPRRAAAQGHETPHGSGLMTVTRLLMRPSGLVTPAPFRLGRAGAPPARSARALRREASTRSRRRSALERDETCPVSTKGWTRRVHFEREGGGGGARARGVERRHQRREAVGAQRALPRWRVRVTLQALAHQRRGGGEARPRQGRDGEQRRGAQTGNKDVGRRRGAHARDAGTRGRHSGAGRGARACRRRVSLLSRYGVRDAGCPISTGRGTRRVRLVRGEGRGVST